MERSIKRTSLCRMSFSITRMPVFRLEIDPGFLFSMLLLAQQSCTCKDMAFACFRMCFCMRHVGCCAHLVFLIHLYKSYQVPRHMGLVTKYSQLLLCTPPVLGLNMSQQSPKSHADFPGKHPQRIGANFSPINTLPKKGPVQTTWC